MSENEKNNRFDELVTTFRYRNWNNRGWEIKQISAQGDEWVVVLKEVNEPAAQEEIPASEMEAPNGDNE